MMPQNWWVMYDMANPGSLTIDIAEKAVNLLRSTAQSHYAHFPVNQVGTDAIKEVQRKISGLNPAKEKQTLRLAVRYRTANVGDPTDIDMVIFFHLMQKKNMISPPISTVDMWVSSIGFDDALLPNKPDFHTGVKEYQDFVGFNGAGGELYGGFSLHWSIVKSDQDIVRFVGPISQTVPVQERKVTAIERYSGDSGSSWRLIDRIRLKSYGKNTQTQNWWGQGNDVIVHVLQKKPTKKRR